MVHLALGLVTFAPVQPVARDTAEPIIVDLALGRLTSRTIETFRLGQRVMIPVVELFGLAEIRVNESTETTVDATIEPGAIRFRAALATRQLAVGRRTLAITDTTSLAAKGQLYLDLDLLTDALGLQASVNWGDLTVTIVDPSSLPIAQRITREWQRARRETDVAGLVADRFLTERRRRVDGLVLDYSLFTPTTANVGGAAFSTAMGLDVLGGSATARLESQGASGVRTEMSWAGVWRDRRWLTQLRLGDGLASGPRPRNVRGISFGNSPYLRPNALGEATFSGTLGPGWQVEAYRGGRLIGFDSVNALGRYAIDAPIAYGENPIELVAYGPFGEVRRFSRSYRADPNRLPVKRLEYGATLGGCRTDRCRATANLDVRYGLNRHWTLQGGLDQFWRPDSSGDLFHPYLGLAGTVANAFGVQVDLVANAIARTSFRYEPRTSLIVNIEATRFARGVVDPILTPGGRTGQLTVSGTYYPADKLGSFFLEAAFDRITTATSTISSGRLGGSYQHHQFQFLPSIRWQRDRTATATVKQTTLSINAYALPTPKLGPILGQATARATLEATAGLAPVTLTAFVSRNIRPDIRFEVGGGWSRLQGPMLSVQLAANLATIRGLTAFNRSRKSLTGTQFVQGSLLYDRRAQRVNFAAGPSLERAGIAGRVFLDRNGNEQFDAGERLLPNVRVTVGMESRMSDQRGEYRLWNVTPHEPALIAVDSTTLESPLWVPTYAAVSVEPGPNRYRVVDIPIAPGGVVEGRVLRGGDSTAVAGVSLVLTHVATGAVRRIASFSDGGFYLIGVKPGEYRLTVDPACTARLGVSASPIRIVVESDPDGATVGGLIVRLDPIRR